MNKYQLVIDKIERGYQSEFISDLNAKDKDVSDRGDAAIALGLLRSVTPTGTSALIAALRDKNPAVRAAAASSLGRRQLGGRKGAGALVAALEDEDAEVRFAAVYALGWFGAVALESIPHLIDILRDDDPSVRTAAVAALAQIQLAHNEADVVAPLIRALVDHCQYPEVRAAAASVLGRLGPASSEITLALLAALADRKQSEVRAAAASALGQLKSKDTQVIDDLLLSLRDDCVIVRAAAAGALEQIGPIGQTVGEALVACLRDKDKATQTLAVRALKKVGPGALLPLCAVLSDVGAALEVRRIAATVLKALALTVKGVDQEAKQFVRVLAGALRDPDREVRSLVIDVLANLGHPAKAAAEALKELIGEEGTSALAFRAAMVLEPIDTERGAVEEEELVRRAAEKINEAVAELPTDKKIHAKAVALMIELPVEEGYEAFKYAWGRVSQAIEQAFTPQLGDALFHHLVHRMRHSSHEDKKTSSTWLNHALREHKRALAFPGSREPSNLRALIGGGSSHYRDGKYCIERRSDQERTPPQDLEQLLPMLRCILAPSRQRATKEEMEQRSHAERELDRQKGRGSRG